jgi:hypothetical protein
MRHWTFWEWVAYAALFVAAVILAADTGVRVSPDLSLHMPEWLHSGWWGFAPLLLVVLSTLVLIANSFGLLPSRNNKWRPTKEREHLTNPSYHFPTPNWHEPLAPIVNQTYRNETVQLDGKDFTDCRFVSVTFLYNGTMPTRFTNCKIGPPGEVQFRTDNPAVSIVHEITNILRELAGEKGIIERNLINKDQH